MIRLTSEQVSRDLQGVVIDLVKGVSAGLDKQTKAGRISADPGFSRITWDLPVIIWHLLGYWGNQFKNTEFKVLAEELEDLIKVARDQQSSTDDTRSTYQIMRPTKNPAFSRLFGQNIEVLFLIGQDGYTAEMNDDQNNQVMEKLAVQLSEVLPAVIESVQVTGLIEIE